MCGPIAIHLLFIGQLNSNQKGFYKFLLGIIFSTKPIQPSFLAKKDILNLQLVSEWVLERYSSVILNYFLKND